MDTRVAWVLNLDADFELAAGARYAPTKSVQNAMKAHARVLVGTLTHEDDLIVDEETPPNAAAGLVGRAFCPTPRALALLRRAGADAEPHPPVDVLRRVNARAFCQALGVTLDDASFETDRARAFAKLARAPNVGDGWRVKRSFGVAGRGQRVVRVGEDASFMNAWLDEGGAQIEPNVSIVAEFAMHGMLARDGRASLGVLVRQETDSAGAWLRSAPTSNAAIESALTTEMTRVARALHEAAYFGPFAIDAFEYRDGDGIRLQPRGEINARYTMGFAAGLKVSCRSKERGDR